MPTPNPAALEFLLSRRSRPAKTLTTPVPSREALLPLLTAAARTPDHGKLEPWRFVVLGQAALARLGQTARLRAQELGYDAEKADKGANQFETGALAVAVIEVQRDWRVYIASPRCDPRSDFLGPPILNCFNRYLDDHGRVKFRGTIHYGSGAVVIYHVICGDPKAFGSRAPQHRPHRY